MDLDIRLSDNFYIYILPDVHCWLVGSRSFLKGPRYQICLVIKEASPERLDSSVVSTSQLIRTELRIAQCLQSGKVPGSWMALRSDIFIATYLYVVSRGLYICVDALASFFISSLLFFSSDVSSFFSSMLLVSPYLFSFSLSNILSIFLFA
jgi:hypothetical protein